MIAIQALNILARRRDPIRDNRSVATAASRFVRKLPSKNSSGGLVSSNDSGDVGLVLCLCGGGRVPSCYRRDAVVGAVGGHSSVIGPVVHKVYDEGNAIGLRGLDDIVKTLEAVSTGVDDWRRP